MERRTKFSDALKQADSDSEAHKMILKLGKRPCFGAPRHERRFGSTIERTLQTSKRNDWYGKLGTGGKTDRLAYLCNPARRRLHTNMHWQEQKDGSYWVSCSTLSPPGDREQIVERTVAVQSMVNPRSLRRVKWN